MRLPLLVSLVVCLFLGGCESFRKPSGWPVETAVSSKAYHHMVEHTKFTGSAAKLTHAEKALLTFLESPDNIAAAVGKKNRPGGHQWSAAEIYLVKPGKHVSVLCENGYQQQAVYFNYEAEQKTWYRVSHLDGKHGKGVAAVVVKD